MSVGEELAAVPVDQLIESVARGIADAQLSLDINGLELAQFMSGVREEDRVRMGSKTYSLLELGFTPTFYQFVDTRIEIRMAISITRSTEQSRSTSETTSRKDTQTSASASGRFSLFSGRASVSARSRRTVNAMASSVNANYTNKFTYSAEGSSRVSTKLVPVPAPGLLNERIRAMIDETGEAAAAAEGEAAADGVMEVEEI